MLRPNRWTIESTLFFAAFLLALLVRFALLGAPVLTNAEAVWAVQALDLSEGRPVILGPQPGYIVLTSFLFSVFGAYNFVARFLPAVAGSLLVLLPVFLRHARGRQAALVLAFGLALDPGLVTLSRTSGSPIPAVSFGLLALGSVYARRPALTGIFAGLALLSGPSIWVGAIVLAAAWGIGRFLETRQVLEPMYSEAGYPFSEGSFFRVALYWLAGVLLVFGTLFLRVPQGLGALAGSIPAYLGGWGSSSDVPAARLLLGLLVYQPLVVVFSIAGAIRSWISGYELGRRLSIWAVVALLLVLLYPSRQMADLVWVLVPLWGLAALEISHHIPTAGSPVYRLVSTSMAVFTFILFAFVWINLAGLGNPAVPNWGGGLAGMGVVILGILAMGLLTTLLISLGWSWETARFGLVWGMVLAFSIYIVANLSGSIRLKPNTTYELWGEGPASGQTHLLSGTLRDLAFWTSGHEGELDIVVLVDAPSMQWALRNWNGARFVSGLLPGEMPPVIISYREQNTLSLAASYRGQSFIWEESPAWQSMVFSDWLRWWAFRVAPSDTHQVILWARADLFPGGTLEPLPGNGLDLEEGLLQPLPVPSE